jgi:cell division septation protein DedD/tetratricopeptide (TPR) repeat protein
MNTTIRAGLVAGVLCLFSLSIQAQSTVAEDLARADKQFDLYAYNLALRTYDQILQKDPKNTHAMARMADCHFQLNRPQESLTYYDKALQLGASDPAIKFHYATALMHTGDYAGAKKWFKDYAASDAATGQHYVDVCEYALQYGRLEGKYAARNEALNTESADYAPAFMAGKVVYNSTRTDIKRNVSSKSASDWSGSAYNQLFVTQRNQETGMLQKPVFLRSDLQNAYNEGPVSYTADGKKVAFCRNNFIDGTRQIAEKGLSLSLYLADVAENGNWNNIKPFPFNGSDFSTGFPCLSPDGKTLIFAANPSTGFGGWDIYVSNFVNGDWTTPRNLGAPLNTPGNEITPFYDGADFYFSSDWHNGLGGLDVFKADLGETEVGNIYNLGTGINSSRDDYGFIYNSGLNLGYLTSNRPGGRGQEDIWQITQKSVSVAATPVTTAWPEKTVSKSDKPAEYATLPATPAPTPTAAGDDGYQHMLVTDDNNEPLNNVEVNLLDCGCGTGRTDANGKYYFERLKRPIDCEVTVRRDAYQDATVQLYNFGQQNVLLAMSKDKKQPFTGYVLDARTHEPLYSAIAMYSIPGTDKLIQTSTDSDGRYTVSLEPGVTYEITYSKEGYKDATVRTKAIAGTLRLTDAQLEKNYDGYYNATPAQYSTIEPVKTLKSATTTPKSETAKGITEPTAPFSGYSIQVAASPDPLSPTQLQSFEPLSKFGNLYVKQEGPITRVRLGVYPGRDEAQKNLKEVNAMPAFRNAFLVEEYGADPNLIVGPPSTAAPVRPSEYSTANMPGKGVQLAAILYAVQIGSFAAEKTININDYAKAAALGNVYTKPENSLTKVRLGVWANYEDAEKAQVALQNRGFQDAMIVTEKASDPSLQGLIIAPATPAVSTPAPASTTAPAPSQYSTNSEVKPAPQKATPAAPSIAPYFIQVAALSNPDNFTQGDLESAGGYIEKRKLDNGMTQVLLAGFPDLPAARTALKKVKDMGHSAAFILKENKGKLQRTN